MTHIKDMKSRYMANYTARKHPKLDHMYEEDRLGSEIVAEVNVYTEYYNFLFEIKHHKFDCRGCDC